MKKYFEKNIDFSEKINFDQIFEFLKIHSCDYFSV